MKAKRPPISRATKPIDDDSLSHLFSSSLYQGGGRLCGQAEAAPRGFSPYFRVIHSCHLILLPPPLHSRRSNILLFMNMFLSFLFSFFFLRVSIFRNINGGLACVAEMTARPNCYTNTRSI
jgi:hypothetical protein